MHSIVDDESENSNTSESDEISRSVNSNKKSADKETKNPSEKSIKFDAFSKAIPKPIKSFKKGIKSVTDNSDV